MHKLKIIQYTYSDPSHGYDAYRHKGVVIANSENNFTGYNPFSNSSNPR